MGSLSDQYVEFQRAVLKKLPRAEELGPDVMQGWITNEPALADGLRNLLLPPPAEKKSGSLAEKKAETPTEEWSRFYREIFGTSPDFAGLRLPAEQRGFGWLVVVAEGMTPNRAYTECEKRFPCWNYADDLDEAVRGRNDREPTAAYAIRVRDRVEADKELANKSADDLAKLGIKGMTLLERLILELWHFWKFGKHLDIQNVTLATGSRLAGGRVPGVLWGGRVGVHTYDPAYRYRYLRSRQVVS